jgi:hypothetical protein
MTHLIDKKTVWLKLALRIFGIGLLPTLTAYPAFGAERLKFNSQVEVETETTVNQGFW